MTPHTAGEPPLTPQLCPQFPAAAKRRRWVLLVAAVLLLAVGAAGTRWWVRRPAPAVPPLPADVQDAEVRAALTRARQAVLDKPNDAYGWGYLGMTLEAHLYETEADRCFAEAARLDPNDVRWPYFRALYALKYDPDHAVSLLRQAASTRSKAEDLSTVRLRLAETLLERHDLDEAEELFRAEARRQPDNPRAAFGLGLSALARGDEPAAEKWLTLAQSSPTARRPAAAQLAALARGRHDEAAAARFEQDATPRASDSLAWPDPLVEQIVQLRVGPDRRAEVFAERVGEFERRHQYREAAQLYLKELEQRPTLPAYLGAGLNLARSGEYEQALPYLRAAVRLDPDSAQAHYTLALVQFTRAEQEWRRSPGSPQATDWFRETVEHARRAADLKFVNARNYLHWGLALDYLGEPAGAVAPLRQGVASHPADEDLQLALGAVLLKTGRLREAETYLENARQLDPSDRRPLEALERLRQKKD